MKALRKELKFLGMTSGDLARILKISDTAISLWLNGTNNPRAVYVRKMIELGINKEAAIKPSEEV